MSTHGPAYDEKLDGKRITKQMGRVLFLMLGRKNGLTLKEICTILKTAHGCEFPESSVSADLRHLRKAKFGGYEVTKCRRKGQEKRGVWEYWVRIPNYEPKQLVLSDQQPTQP